MDEKVEEVRKQALYMHLLALATDGHSPKDLGDSPADV